MSSDRNVEGVRAKLLARSEVGIRKYGTTTERTDLNLRDWLTHLQEELMDAAVYIEAALQREDDCPHSALDACDCWEDGRRVR